jgi:hypothetical protein
MTPITHILKHPHRFPSIAHAHINVNPDGTVLLFVRTDSPPDKRSWMPSSLLGAKQIFGREYGNGAEWERAETPILQASDVMSAAHLTSVPKRLYFGKVYFDFYLQLAKCTVCNAQLEFKSFVQHAKYPLPEYWQKLSEFSILHNKTC